MIAYKKKVELSLFALYPLTYLQVIFQDLCKVVLQFRPSKELEQFFPIRRIIKFTQVWFHLARENLECCGFANTVRADETQDLTRTRHRKAMEFEGIGRVAMRHLGFEIGGQIDNVNGPKGALFGADTAANTKRFGDGRDLTGAFDFDTKLAYTKQEGWAGLLPPWVECCLPIRLTGQERLLRKTRLRDDASVLLCELRTILVDISWVYICQHWQWQYGLVYHSWQQEEEGWVESENTSEWSSNQRNLSEFMEKEKKLRRDLKRDSKSTQPVKRDDSSMVWLYCMCVCVCTVQKGRIYII